MTDRRSEDGSLNSDPDKTAKENNFKKFIGKTTSVEGGDLGTVPDKYFVIRHRMDMNLFDSRRSFAKEPHFITREYYEPLPEGSDSFTQVGRLEFREGRLRSVETRGEELEFDKKQFYPIIRTNFTDYTGALPDSFGINLATGSDLGDFHFSYNLSRPEKIPSIGFFGENFIFRSLVPNDIPNEVVFLKTLLRNSSQKVTIRNFISNEEANFEVSLVTDKKTAEDNRVSIRKLGRKKVKGVNGEEVEQVVTIAECVFPLTISKDDVEGVIQRVFPQDLLKDPTLIPENPSDLDELDKWLREDWMRNFGIHVDYSGLRLGGEEFKARVEQAKSNVNVPSETS